VDLARKIQYLTLDVITSLAFGERFGFVDEDRDVHKYIEMTEQNMPVMLILGCLPDLAVLLQSPLFRWLMPSEHDRLGFGKFIGWVPLLHRPVAPCCAGTAGRWA
jgi:hypothetical protein